MARLSTRTGDDGTTGLLYGGRVSKADPRVEAYGTVDEAVSALGLARALSRDERVRAMVREVQRDLFTVGAELATDPARRETYLAHFRPVTPEMTARVDAWLEALEAEVQLPRSFILPGGSPASSALDLARSILRRAERRAVALKDAGLLPNPEILRYLNRVSDLLFLLARYEDRDLPPEPVSQERG